MYDHSGIRTLSAQPAKTTMCDEDCIWNPKLSVRPILVCLAEPGEVRMSGEKPASEALVIK